MELCHAPLFHTQLFHISLRRTHTTLSHSTLLNTTLSHKTPVHTAVSHAQAFTSNFVTYSSFTCNAFTNTHAHTHTQTHTHKVPNTHMHTHTQTHIFLSQTHNSHPICCPPYHLLFLPFRSNVHYCFVIVVEPDISGYPVVLLNTWRWEDFALKQQPLLCFMGRYHNVFVRNPLRAGST